MSPLRTLSWARPTVLPTPRRWPWPTNRPPVTTRSTSTVRPALARRHLLYAIANEIHRQHPDFKIVYIKGDQFTNELITALQEGKNVEFRSKYRGADLFLVDDIQFIAGKTSTQEEFFHTFNTLYEAKKQIVLTSDRPAQRDAPTGGPPADPLRVGTACRHSAAGL